MDTLEYYFHDRLAIILYRIEAVEKTAVPEEEMEGIAAIPRQIEGLKSGDAVPEGAAPRYRFSMRQQPADRFVQNLCQAGGGGHARAAGCTLYGTLGEVKEQIIAELKKEFRQK